MARTVAAKACGGPVEVVEPEQVAVGEAAAQVGDQAAVVALAADQAEDQEQESAVLAVEVPGVAGGQEREADQAVAEGARALVEPALEGESEAAPERALPENG